MPRAVVASEASRWWLSWRSFSLSPCAGAVSPAAQCAGGHDDAGERGGRGDQNAAVGIRGPPKLITARTPSAIG